MAIELAFRNWVYRHHMYAEAFDALEFEIRVFLEGRDPFVFMLLGQSRAGKSELLRDICAKFPAPDGATRSPVLYVTMPAMTNLDTLAKRILKTLLGVDIKLERGQDPKDVAREMLKAWGVRILILDETNHLAEKYHSFEAQSKANRAVADWLKELHDPTTLSDPSRLKEEAGLSVVLSGLQHTVSLFVDNEQLEGRALSARRLSAYDWYDSSDQEHFVLAVTAFVNRLKENGWLVKKEDSAKIIKGAYLCSGGLIGHVCALFISAETVCGGNKALSLDLLQRAYARKFPLRHYGNPFALKEFPDELLNEAHQQTLAKGMAPTFQKNGRKKQSSAGDNRK